MRFLLSFFAALVVITSPALANDKLTISDVHTRETAPSQKNGAAFLTIESRLPEDDFLYGAEAAVSEHVELHTHLIDDGIMMMRKVEGYAVPAGGSLTLDPMGHHVMFINLYEPFKKGHSFPMTLLFEKAGRIETEVVVKAIGE